MAIFVFFVVCLQLQTHGDFLNVLFVRNYDQFLLSVETVVQWLA